MNGAREYAMLFGGEEIHGRLLISSGIHARGRTFHIWVMPEVGRPNHFGHAPRCESVEVYGILGGQPGWTEHYGWLHAGPWQDDFAAIVKKRRAEIAQREAERIERAAQAEDALKRRAQRVLDTYKPGVQP